MTSTLLHIDPAHSVDVEFWRATSPLLANTLDESLKMALARAEAHTDVDAGMVGAEEGGKEAPVEGKEGGNVAKEGQFALYLCAGTRCQLPVRSVEEAEKVLSTFW